MEQATQITPESTTQGSNQSEYVSDALDNVSGDDQQQAQTPKEQQQQQDLKAQTPKDAGQQQQNAQKPVTPVQSDPIDAIFRNDKGEFDAQAFMSFSLPSDFSKPVEQPQVPAQQPGQPIDNRPEWQREMEEIRTYETNFRSNTLDPLQKVWDLIESGVDPQQALKQVYVEREKFVNNHLAEYKYKRDFEKQEKLHNSAKEAENMAKMKVNSSTNINAIISALPGNDQKAKTELFSHLMFSKDIGAPILNREFKRRYPDVGKLSQAEQNAQADKFLLEIQSDREELAYFWELCLNKAARLKQKDVAQQHRMLGAAQAQETRQAAQKHPAGPYNRKPVVSQKDPWSSYLGSSADRV